MSNLPGHLKVGDFGRFDGAGEEGWDFICRKVFEKDGAACTATKRTSSVLSLPIRFSGVGWRKPSLQEAKLLYLHLLWFVKQFWRRRDKTHGPRNRDRKRWMFCSYRTPQQQYPWHSVLQTLNIVNGEIGFENGSLIVGQLMTSGTSRKSWWDAPH